MIFSLSGITRNAAYYHQRQVQDISQKGAGRYRASCPDFDYWKRPFRISLRRFYIYFCLQGLLLVSLTLTYELLNYRCCPREDSGSDMGAFHRLRYLSLLQLGKICPLEDGAYSITGLTNPLGDLGISGNSDVILALLCCSISSMNFQCSGWWRRLRAFFTLIVFSFSSLPLPSPSPSRCLPLLLLLLLLFEYFTLGGVSTGQRTVSSSIPGAKRVALALGASYGLVSVEVSCESVHPILFLLLYYIIPSNSKDLQNIGNFTSFSQNKAQASFESLLLKVLSRINQNACGYEVFLTRIILNQKLLLAQQQSKQYQ